MRKRLQNIRKKIEGKQTMEKKEQATRDARQHKRENEK